MTRMMLLVFLLLLNAADAAAAPKSKSYRLSWRERGGLIEFSTVCENYGYGSLDYRGCRLQAKRHFEQKCKEYAAKVDDSRGATRERYRRREHTFCHAASQFSPIN